MPLLDETDPYGPSMPRPLPMITQGMRPPPQNGPVIMDAGKPLAQQPQGPGALQRIGQGFANGNPLPMTTQAMSNAGTNFSRNMDQGQYARAAGGMLRDTALGVQSFVDDTLVRPSRAVANTVADVAPKIWSGLTGQAQPAAPAAQRAAPSLANLPSNGDYPDAARIRQAGLMGPSVANMNPPAPLGGGEVQDGLRLGTVQGGLSSQDRLGQMERDYASQRDLNAAKAAQLAKTDAPPGMAFIGNPGPEAAQKFFDEANLRNAAAKGSWSPRGGYKGDDAAVAAAAVPITNRAKLAELSLRNAGDQSIAAMRDKTDRRGQDLQAQTASLRDQTDRRGQDVTARGQDMTAKTAAAKARLDQQNDDRKYDLDKAKFGVDVAEKNRSARAAESKALDDELGSQFRTKDDKGNDVADTAKVGQFKSALGTTIEQLIARHEASGDPQRTALAKQLRERGPAAMDAKDLGRLRQAFETRSRLQQSKGMGPNSGSYVDSDNLLDFMQDPKKPVEASSFGGDRLRFQGGSSASVRDLQYKDGPANAILPDWLKTRDNDLLRGLKY